MKYTINLWITRSIREFSAIWFMSQLHRMYIESYGLWPRFSLFVCPEKKNQCHVTVEFTNEMPMRLLTPSDVSEILLLWLRTVEKPEAVLQYDLLCNDPKRCDAWMYLGRLGEHVTHRLDIIMFDRTLFLCVFPQYCTF